MKPIFHEKLRKSKQESKLAKPPKKKHLNINKGPSTNLEASVQTDELLETGSVLARLPLPPPPAPRPPRALLTSPGDLCQQPRQRQTRWALSPQAGLPVAELTVDAAAQPGSAPSWQGLASHQLLSTLHASRSQAEGVTGGS